MHLVMHENLELQLFSLWDTVAQMKSMALAIRQGSVWLLTVLLWLIYLILGLNGPGVYFLFVKTIKTPALWGFSENCPRQCLESA